MQSTHTHTSHTHTHTRTIPLVLRVMPTDVSTHAAYSGEGYIALSSSDIVENHCTFYRHQDGVRSVHTRVSHLLLSWLLTCPCSARPALFPVNHTHTHIHMHTHAHACTGCSVVPRVRVCLSTALPSATLRLSSRAGRSCRLEITTCCDSSTRVRRNARHGECRASRAATDRLTLLLAGFFFSGR